MFVRCFICTLCSRNVKASFQQLRRTLLSSTMTDHGDLTGVGESDQESESLELHCWISRAHRRRSLTDKSKIFLLSSSHSLVSATLGRANNNALSLPRSVPSLEALLSSVFVSFLVTRRPCNGVAKRVRRVSLCSTGLCLLAQQALPSWPSPLQRALAAAPPCCANALPPHFSPPPRVISSLYPRNQCHDHPVVRAAKRTRQPNAALPPRSRVTHL